jgi:hypothetical protein
MDLLTLMTNNNCDILRKSVDPDFRVPPINLDDLPKFLLGTSASAVGKSNNHLRSNSRFAINVQSSFLVSPPRSHHPEVRRLP